MSQLYWRIAVKDESNLLKLAAQFRQGADFFRSHAMLPRADFLGPPRMDFEVLSSFAVEELHLPLVRGFPSRESDVDAQRQGGEIGPCTVTWLEFLRRQNADNHGTFTATGSGGYFTDIWAASATQCQKSAIETIHERIQAGIDAEPANQGGVVHADQPWAPEIPDVCKQPVRRNAKYEEIDSALREISQARPKSHEEVFRFLDDRNIALPGRKVFRDGWLKGFQQNRPTARAWLSQAWARLDLPPFPRGPKK
jgi:hypothetical protein